MPALTIPQDINSIDVEATTSAYISENGRDRTESPTRPSYSPITPVLTSASLASTSESYQHAQSLPSPPFVSSPPTTALSETDNPDAIALRSAIAILQMQRQQSLRDLTMLERQKHGAVANPERFAQALETGEIATRDDGMRLCPNSKTKRQASFHMAMDEGSSDSEVQTTQSQDCGFGPIPTPQNIVRCPPINWNKYHVVGESLDKLHDEQRLRPLPGETSTNNSSRAPLHLVAAPYRPFVDKIVDPPMRTRSVSKKG